MDMKHDGQGNDCPVTGYVMGFSAAASQGEFSDCSMEAFNDWVVRDHVNHVPNAECLTRLGRDPDTSADIKDHAGGLVPAVLLTALCMMAHVSLV